MSIEPIGDKRTQAAGYDNTVTPPTAEVLGCALAEAITGETIERSAVRPLTFRAKSPGSSGCYLDP